MHMKRILLKTRQYANKGLLVVLAFLGFSSVQSCGKKEIEKSPKEKNLQEIRCMYGGPESFYRRIDKDSIQIDVPEEDRPVKEE